jgi:hypothetical protein
MIGAPVFRYVLTPGWAGDSLARAAQAVPSLDLNFAVTKTVGPLVAFTRASTATFIDSAGTLQTAAVDVPRFDHNPTTGESLGLLVEEQRTNLVQQSADISNAYWVKTETTVTANAIAAPDGTTTAGKLIESTANSQHILNSAAITWVGNTQYTATFYAKAGERFNFDILFGTAGNWVNSERVATFNLNTGTVLFPPNSPAIASIQAVGNNWYRCRVTATTTASPSASAVFIRMADDAGLTSYQGINGHGLYFWAAQLEAGAFPTSYIPTTTAAATRSADVASITGANFSSWYRQDEGTIYGEYIITVATSDGTLTSFDDGTANNRWQQRFTSIGQRYRLQSGGVSLVDDISTSAPLINATNKVAHAIRAGDQRHAGNGLLNAIALIASPLPTVTQLQIATGPGAGNAGRITIRRLTYWPQRLPNSTLQAITQ